MEGSSLACWSFDARHGRGKATTRTARHRLTQERPYDGREERGSGSVASARRRTYSGIVVEVGEAVKA
jgi:hypothetical protein